MSAHCTDKMVWFGGRLIVYYQCREKPTLICAGTAEQQGRGTMMVVVVVVYIVYIMISTFATKSSGQYASMDQNKTITSGTLVRLALRNLK